MVLIDATTNVFLKKFENYPWIIPNMPFLKWTFCSNQLHLPIRSLDKREYLVIIRDSFCQFCIKTYVVTPHLNCLETVQMRDHNIMISIRNKKTYHQILTLIQSSGNWSIVIPVSECLTYIKCIYFYYLCCYLLTFFFSRLQQILTSKTFFFQNWKSVNTKIQQLQILFSFFFSFIYLFYFLSYYHVYSFFFFNFLILTWLF